MKIVVLIKPSYTLSKKILSLKNKFKKTYSKCLFVDDFPHITLLSINTNKNLSIFKKIFIPINLRKIKISLSSPNIFQNDPLTGGRTFFYNLKKNTKLFELQLIISKFLIPFVNNNKKNIFPKKTKEYKSMKKYGFPFVGNHWIPHITICSVIDKVCKRKLDNFFFKKKINLSFYANEILICKADNRNLKILKKIKFVKNV